MIHAEDLTRRKLLLALPGFFALRRLSAQQPDSTTFSTDVNLVNLFATVRNKQGQIIRNLTKDDFLLDEDGQPQVIKYFTQESNLQLTLGLLIDTSGSQRRVLEAERRASYRFLEQVLREDKDLAFVIHFDREVELLQDLTASRRKLEAALTGLKVNEGGGMQRRGAGGGGYPGGGGPVPSQGGGRQAGTTLYDSVLLASDELMKKQGGRKALILLSDGVDNGSKVGIGAAIESAQRADTMVYSVLFSDGQAYGSGGFSGPSMGGRRRGGGGYPRRPVQNRPDGRKVLQRLSRETGGGYFEVSKKLPIEEVYRRIEEELRNQYSIGYTPKKGDPGLRRIHLTAKQKGLVVQTRESYYSK